MIIKRKQTLLTSIRINNDDDTDLINHTRLFLYILWSFLKKKLKKAKILYKLLTSAIQQAKKRLIMLNNKLKKKIT